MATHAVGAPTAASWATKRYERGDTRPDARFTHAQNAGPRAAADGDSVI